jgi:predicted nuclease with TOPRIM domain
MVSDPYEIVLDHLRDIRAENKSLGEAVERVEKRLNSVDRQLAGFRNDFAIMHQMYADHRDEFGELRDRVERIERRLDLAETPVEH